MSRRLGYLVFCRTLAWLAVLTRSRANPHAELLVRRHENQVLCRTNPNPKLDWLDRFLLAGLCWPPMPATTIGGGPIDP